MHIYHIKIWWFVWFCENVSQMDPLSCRFCCADRSACHTCAWGVAERSVGFFDQRIYQVHNDRYDLLTTPHWISTRMNLEHVKCTCAGCGLLNCLGLTKPWWKGQERNNGSFTSQGSVFAMLIYSWKCPVVCSQAHINFLIHVNTHTHICIYVYV